MGFEKTQVDTDLKSGGSRRSKLQKVLWRDERGSRENTLQIDLEI